MRYIEPIRNIESLLREIDVVGIDQLFLFFRDEMIPKTVLNYVRQMAKDGLVDYDKKRGIVSRHNAKYFLSEGRLNSKLKAFWIVAYFGSQAVLDVVSLKPPFVFEMLVKGQAEKDSIEIYDIVICNTTTEATLAARILQRNAIKDVPDEVVHLCIVPDEEIGNRLEPYGFDAFVTMKVENDDELNLKKVVPIFHEWR